MNNNFNFLDFGFSMAAGAAAGWLGGNGLLAGAEGLQIVGNSLVKNLMVKNLTIKSFSTFTKYLLPILKSTSMTVAGSIAKMIL